MAGTDKKRTMTSHPLLRLSPRADRRLQAGYPWAFSNEIAMTPSLALGPGAPVRGKCRRVALRHLRLQPAQPDRRAVPRPRPGDRHRCGVRPCTDRGGGGIARADLRQPVPSSGACRGGPVARPHRRQIRRCRRGAGERAAMDLLLPEITARVDSELPLHAVVARNDSAARTQEGCRRRCGCCTARRPMPR